MIPLGPRTLVGQYKALDTTAWKNQVLIFLFAPSAVLLFTLHTHPMLVDS